METLMISIKNEKARKLIEYLEELDIIEVQEQSYLQTKPSTPGVSNLKNKIVSPMKEEAINKQLEQIRSEWQRNI